MPSRPRSGTERRPGSRGVGSNRKEVPKLPMAKNSRETRGKSTRTGPNEAPREQSESRPLLFFYFLQSTLADVSSRFFRFVELTEGLEPGEQ